MNSRKLLAFLAALAVVILAVGILFRGFPRPPAIPPAPLPEVLRSELARQADRLHRSGETNPFTGFMIDRYANGSMQSRSQVSNGLLHGLSEGWHTNGTLQIRESFVAGVSHGLRTKWYPEGVKASEAPIEQGRIQGTFRRWHPNGVLAEEIPMKDDQPEGVSRAFHPSGTLKARVVTRAGQVVERESWEDGKAPAEPVPSTTAPPSQAASP